MRQMPDKSIDLVLTDPPYGIGSRFKSKFGMQIEKKKWEDFSWNDKIPSKEVFDEIMRVSKNQIIFGGNYFTQYLRPTNAWLVWDKIGQYDLKNPFSDCELAWTSFSCTVKKYTFVNMGFIAGKEEKGKRIHPTQKPLQLFQAILQDFSKPCDIVFDPFSGSGTTAVAAYQLGNQRYRIHNQRHEISNRLKENERLRALLEECWYRIPQIPINLKLLEKIQETLAVAKIQASPAADIKIQESEARNETC